MEENKTKKGSLNVIVIIVAIIIVGVMGYLLYKNNDETQKIRNELETIKDEKVDNNEKNEETKSEYVNTNNTTNTAANATTNTTANTATNTATSTVTNTTTNKETTSTNKSVKYKFESADSMAAKGDPGILNIYELTDSKMEFDYNHGWDFAQSTIDRKISGTATKNSEGLYEYNESVNGHQYKITIKYIQSQVTLREYTDGSLSSETNLWS